MAKLVIFRGDAHHADIELPEHAVQIGRGPQNDIVLEDHGKGVSRTHAELRFEGGHHVLADKESQNGIWVSGSRVTSVVLEPGVVASVGPYRLTVEESGPTTELAAPEDPTEIAVRPGRQLQSGEESPARGGPAEEDGSPVAQPIDGGRLPGRSPSEKRRELVLTTAAVLLFGVVVYGVYTVLRPANPEPRADDWVAPATQMVNAGRCPDALTQHIGPALERNPKDPAALRLKERCQPTPLPPPGQAEGPPPPTAAEVLLGEADALLASNQKPDNKECQTALEKVNEVLATDPANERALGLKKTAETCLQPTAKTKGQTVWIAEVDPEKGGLPPLPKESPQDHETRVRYAAAKYDEAQTRAAEGDYDGAEKTLSDLPTNFKGVPELLESIRLAKNKRQAADLIVRARAAASRDDFANAAEWYRRAQELNPSAAIEKEIQDMDSRRLQLAKEKCIAAEARNILRPTEAKGLYAEALRLLRRGELCYAEASERGK